MFQKASLKKERLQQLDLKVNMVIYGASGHGKVLKAIALSIYISTEAFVDDNCEEDVYLGVPVRTITDYDKIMVGIGNNTIRKKIATMYKNQWHKPLIHNKAIVSLEEDVGLGTAIMAGVIVNEAKSIGNHCILNTGALIEHDCIIEDYAHISPNVTLSGDVIVSEGAHVGAGAVVIQGITIGKWSVVGAGAVVIRDVPDYAVVVGNPARVIKFTKSD